MWNPENYPGVQTIRFPSSQVWVPDILLYNRYGGLLFPPLPHCNRPRSPFFILLPLLPRRHLISFVLRSLCTSPLLLSSLPDRSRNPSRVCLSDIQPSVPSSLPLSCVMTLCFLIYSLFDSPVLSSPYLTVSTAGIPPAPLLFPNHLLFLFLLLRRTYVTH